MIGSGPDTFSWRTYFPPSPGHIILESDSSYILSGRTEFPRKMCPPGHIGLADRFSSDTGPTRACAPPSTLQSLPSAISFESRDSTMDQTKINCSANNHKSVTNINATAYKLSTISQEGV